MGSNGSKVNEKIIQEIWKQKVLEKEFRTFDDKSITVINTGIENTDMAGPDFRNAKVRIDNLVYVGDIEIDVDYNDWKTHGHYLDKRYNKVVVHATLLNKNHSSYVFCKDGRKIPSICLAEYFKDDFIDINKEELDENSQNSHYLRCIDTNSLLDSRTKKEILKKLGTDRFNKRKEKILFRLKELIYIKEHNLKEPVIKYDISDNFLNREFSINDFKVKEFWQQLFYEFVFEALGYSKNKNAMRLLAQSANIDFIKSITDKTDINTIIHSSLFNIAGLIWEDHNKNDDEYLIRISEIWNTIKENYDGRILDKSNWHFFKLRPNNFPTIRIAGGAALLRKIAFEEFLENILSRFNRIQNLGTLIRVVKTLFIIPADGYWKHHYTIGEKKNIELKYFIGGSRADEIIINVVLPFISVYAEVFGNENLVNKVYGVYLQYIQNEDNSISKFISESLGLDNAWKKSIISQGMLELFRTYCSKNKCMECSIGKMVFN